MPPNSRQASGGAPAFTLLELLVCIVIVGVLLALLLPTLGRAREAGRRVACAAQLRGFAPAFIEPKVARPLGEAAPPSLAELAAWLDLPEPGPYAPWLCRSDRSRRRDFGESYHTLTWYYDFMPVTTTLMADAHNGHDERRPQRRNRLRPDGSVRFEGP